MARAALPTINMRDEVAAFKRERIIDAAADLFHQLGYDNTTLDAVAEQLGMSKPFIYANFGSKSELLAAICTQGVAAAHEAADEIFALRLAPAPTLRKFVERYVSVVLKYRKHIAVYTREEKNLARGDGRRIGEMRRSFFAKLFRLLEKGKASGDFHVEDCHIAALTIGGAVTWTTFWYKPDGRLSAGAIAAEITASVLRLAGVREGMA